MTDSPQYIRNGDRICFAESNTCYRLSDPDPQGAPSAPPPREEVDVKATVQTPVVPKYEREGETIETQRSDDFSGEH